jgi:hypothetical protein
MLRLLCVHSATASGFAEAAHTCKDKQSGLHALQDTQGPFEEGAVLSQERDKLLAVANRFLSLKRPAAGDDGQTIPARAQTSLDAINASTRMREYSSW